jgi:hypothetical protein
LSRLAAVGGDIVKALEKPHREIVGDHDAGESELAAQKVVEDRGRARAGEPIDLVVGVHDRRQPGLANRRSEGARIDLTQLPRTEVNRGVIHSSLGEAVAKKVLRGGRDTGREVLALESPHVGDTDSAHQVRILAIGLLDPTPARIPRDVEHRSQGLVGPDRAHLSPDHRGSLLDDLRIPAAREPDCLGELSGVAGHEPGGALLVHDRGNAETRVGRDPVLDLVRKGGDLGRTQAGGPRNAGDVTGAVTEELLGALFGEGALLHQPGRPDTAELRELLIEIHAREQIRGPILDAERRIAIRRGLC